MHLQKVKYLLTGLCVIVFLCLVQYACRTVRSKPVNVLIRGSWQRLPIDTATNQEVWTFGTDGYLKISDAGTPRLFVDRFGIRDTLMPYKLSLSGAKWKLFTENYFTPNDQNVHWIVVEIDARNLYLSSIQSDGRRSMEQREFVRIN